MGAMRQGKRVLLFALCSFVVMIETVSFLSPIFLVSRAHSPQWPEQRPERRAERTLNWVQSPEGFNQGLDRSVLNGAAAATVAHMPAESSGVLRFGVARCGKSLTLHLRHIFQGGSNDFDEGFEQGRKNGEEEGFRQALRMVGSKNKSVRVLCANLTQALAGIQDTEALKQRKEESAAALLNMLRQHNLGCEDAESLRPTQGHGPEIWQAAEEHPPLPLLACMIYYCIAALGGGGGALCAQFWGERYGHTDQRFVKSHVFIVGAGFACVTVSSLAGLGVADADEGYPLRVFWESVAAGAGGFVAAGNWVRPR